MPLSKNGTFFYLLHGEHVDFKFANLDESFIDERRNIKQLSVPIATHISNKPFKGTNFKVMVCRGGDRCYICKSKHVPVDLYPLQIIIPSLGQKELNIDLQPSAHNAVLACVQKMLDRGATTTDIVNTEFRMRRLPKGERPFFDCVIIDDKSIPIEHPIEVIDEGTDLLISDTDKRLLEKLSAALDTKTYKNSRGAVIATLRSKGWSDEKIDVAFKTLLNEDGRLKNR